MRIHKVNDCCCGCTLETGTKIIAWMQIICGILMTISFIATVAVVNNVDSADRFNSFSNYTIPYSTDSSSNTIDTPKPNISVFVTYIVTGGFTIIFGLILLIGASKRRPHLLNVWVVISMIGLVVYVLGTIIQVIVAMVYGLIASGVVLLVTSMLTAFIYYYTIMVVSSYRKQIMSGNNTV